MGFKEWQSDGNRAFLATAGNRWTIKTTNRRKAYDDSFSFGVGGDFDLVRGVGLAASTLSMLSTLSSGEKRRLGPFPKTLARSRPASTVPARAIRSPSLS